MPIAIGDQVYEDEVHYNASLLGIELPKEDTSSTTPLKPTTLPADALKSQEGTQVPENTNASPERYQTWPERMVRGAIQAMALPGDVLSGKVQPGSPQEIERAMDLAGLMVFGPAPVAAKMADGTLGSFAGVVSKTLPKEELKMAQKLESEGVHPDDIWKQTGFFKDKSDGRWRYEISDEGSSLTDRDWKFGDKGKLSEFFDHPELYKAYPDLKNTNFEVKDLGPGSLGGYDPNTKTIIINPKALGGSDTAIIDTIHHELQHRIQDIEGFTSGSNPAREKRKAIQEIRNRIGDLSKEHTNTGSLYEDPRFLELSKLHEELTNPYSKFNSSNGESFWNYLYTRSPGEIEANQVVFRRNFMNAEERKKLSPQQLQDILAKVEYKDKVANQKFRQPFYYPE